VKFIRDRRGVEMTVATELSISITAKELAAAFCEMDGDQQATFFSEVDRVMQAWSTGSPSMQRHYIAASIKAHSMDGARHWLEDIGRALEGE
jgi:hypothetical protein